MATVKYRVNYHWEVGGKLEPQFGQRQAIVSCSDGAGTDGASRPVAANISTVLGNNGLNNAKSSAVLVIDNVANLEPASPAAALS